MVMAKAVLSDEPNYKGTAEKKNKKVLPAYFCYSETPKLPSAEVWSNSR